MRFLPFACLSFALTTLLLAWALCKRPHGIGLEEAYTQLDLRGPGGPRGGSGRRGATGGASNTVLLAAGVVSFGTFNLPSENNTQSSRHTGTAVIAELNGVLR